MVDPINVSLNRYCNGPIPPFSKKYIPVTLETCRNWPMKLVVNRVWKLYIWFFYCVFGYHLSIPIVILKINENSFRCSTLKFQIYILITYSRGMLWGLILRMNSATVAAVTGRRGPLLSEPVATTKFCSHIIRFHTRQPHGKPSFAATLE